MNGPLKSQKTKSRKAGNHLHGFENMIVMDDEKCFIYYCDGIPGTDRFFTGNIDLGQDEVRYKGKEKYLTLILVLIQR